MDEFTGDNDTGARLKSLREEMRASQREFGEALGFNQAAVSALLELVQY
jgi:transcriptional regulator with XRE-family HTH domain